MIDPSARCRVLLTLVPEDVDRSQDLRRSLPPSRREEKKPKVSQVYPAGHNRCHKCEISCNVVAGQLVQRTQSLFFSEAVEAAAIGHGVRRPHRRRDRIPRSSSNGPTGVPVAEPPLLVSVRPPRNGLALLLHGADALAATRVAPRRCPETPLGLRRRLRGRRRRLHHAADGRPPGLLLLLRAPLHEGGAPLEPPLRDRLRRFARVEQLLGGAGAAVAAADAAVQGKVQEAVTGRDAEAARPARRRRPRRGGDVRPRPARRRRQRGAGAAVG